MGPHSHVSVVDYYTDVVLPALAERLDAAFPEFGWRRDARGWIATNEETTHRVLGVRAGRVVAHGPAPRGFLVHGGEATLWTAYVSGGDVPRGESFNQAVHDLARRAGVDTAPIEQPVALDRRTDLLHDFFTLCRWELAADAGAKARKYLKQRGLPADALERCGLGVVPGSGAVIDCLQSSGYSGDEIAQSGVLADSRWHGRLCGGWRDERRRIKTLWVRSFDTGGEQRYLYLRGATRTNLPPYGLPRHVSDLVLVEGFFDYHQLAARGIENVAALGGTSTSPATFERLSQLGVATVVLCLDNDVAGRVGTARAVENAARASRSPAVYVIGSDRLGAAKDPDELVRVGGVAAWQALLGARECGVAWRAKEIAGDVAPDAALAQRREALARAGGWLGTLPARLALEQEDAVHAVAQSCGYSPEAVGRAFRARFFRDVNIVRPSRPPVERQSWQMESGIEF